MSDENIPEAFFEKYPESVVKQNQTRIWQQIVEYWGSQECADYLESLLLVEEGRDRQGFNSVVISELLLLALLHDQAHPEFSSHPKLGEGNQFIYDSSDEETGDS